MISILHIVAGFSSWMVSKLLKIAMLEFDSECR
jgi:hypothetical protein